MAEFLRRGLGIDGESQIRRYVSPRTGLPVVHLGGGPITVEDVRALWPGSTAAPFATCPITQGTLLRTLLRRGDRVTAAVDTVRSLVSDDRHEFWADDLEYSAVRTAGVTGHRQVTDAHLAGLARAHGGRLATFDKGLTALHPDVVGLVATI